MSVRWPANATPESCSRIEKPEAGCPPGVVADRSGGEFGAPADLGAAYARAETQRKKGDQIEVPGKGYHDEEGDFIKTKAKLGLVRALINYGRSMWTLAQFDVEDVDSVDGAEQVLAWVRGAAEFGVEAAAGVLEDVDGMEPMEAVARIRDLLNQDEV